MIIDEQIELARDMFKRAASELNFRMITPFYLDRNKHAFSYILGS